MYKNDARKKVISCDDHNVYEIDCSYAEVTKPVKNQVNKILVLFTSISD